MKQKADLHAKGISLLSLPLRCWMNDCCEVWGVLAELNPLKRALFSIF